MVHATIFLFVYLYQWLTNVHGIFSYGINIPWKMECEEVLPFTCRVPWVFSWGKLPIKSWSLQRRHRKSMHIRCVILGLEDWNRKKKNNTHMLRATGTFYLRVHIWLKLMVNVPEHIPVPWSIWEKTKHQPIHQPIQYTPQSLTWNLKKWWFPSSESPYLQGLNFRGVNFLSSSHWCNF